MKNSLYVQEFDEDNNEKQNLMSSPKVVVSLHSSSKITTSSPTTNSSVIASNRGSEKLKENSSTNNSFNKKSFINKTKQIFNKSGSNSGGSGNISASSGQKATIDSIVELTNQTESADSVGGRLNRSRGSSFTKAKTIEISVTCNDSSNNPSQDSISDFNNNNRLKASTSKFSYLNKKFGGGSNSNATALAAAVAANSNNPFFAGTHMTRTSPSTNLLLVPQAPGNYHSGRRESFLYRNNDTESDNFTKLQRNSSVAAEQYV